MEVSCQVCLILNDWSPSRGLSTTSGSVFKCSSPSMSSLGGEEMIVMLLHCFTCITTSTRPVYSGKSCGLTILGLNSSANMLISTPNGQTAVLSKMKATFLTLVLVLRQTFDQMCGMASVIKLAGGLLFFLPFPYLVAVFSLIFTPLLFLWGGLSFLF